MVVIDPDNRYIVPAIPDETLSQVFGQRTIDPRAEMAVLYVEFWIVDGFSLRISHDRILTFLKKHIDASNIRDFISLLAKRGYTERFFDLTRSTVDRNGELRSYLNSLGVENIEISYYRDWDGSETAGLLAGCVVGIGESFATIVVDIIEMGKLLLKLAQYQMRTIKKLVTDPDAGLTDIHNQAEMIGKLLDSLVEQLDISRLPSEVVNTWREWNVEFEKHLENHEPFDAGRHLGRIAGDLWQLLTGIRALGKLLQATGKKAMEHAPLMFRSLRSTAAKSQEVIADMAKLLLSIGRNVIDEIPTVGLDVLRTMFPPEVLRKLFKEGRAFLVHNNITLMPIIDRCYQHAFPGNIMPSRFMVGVFEEGKPMLMASMSERIVGATREEAMAAIDEMLDRIDELFKEPGRRSLKLSLKEATVNAEAIKLLKQRIDTSLQNLLQKITYESFTELRRSKQKFYPKDLGLLIHKRMAHLVPVVISQVAPGAWFRTEKKLSTIVEELLNLSNSASPGDLARAKESLNKSVASLLAKRDDVLDVLGLEKTAAARTEKSITKFLKEHFGIKGSTTVGDLQSDLTIADPKIKHVINVDFTSSTNSDQFEKLWKKVNEDLGKKFNGNWSKLDEEYAKAGKGKAPEEVKLALDKLTWHAVRETVIRKAALEEALGIGWQVSSREMLYDGFARLFKKEADAISAN